MRAEQGGNVLIVEDNDDIRYLLALMIELADGLDLTAEATTGEEGIVIWRERHPEVVLLDYRLPGRDGLDVAEEILREDPDQTVVLFSAYLDDATIRRAETIGVAECVSKDEISRIPDIILGHLG
jgi:DNA-binding NarL/FixJ family response regulator